MTEVIYAWHPEVQGLSQDYRPQGLRHDGKVMRIREYRGGDERITRMAIPGFVTRIEGAGRFSFVETYEAVPLEQQSGALAALKERYPQIEEENITVVFHLV